jgi:hypothetical protein
MSLTSCIRRAGDALDASDREFILTRARALRAEGVAADEAGRRAVDERLAEVQAMVAGEVARANPQPPAQSATPQAAGEGEAETDAIDQRIADAEAAGVVLSENDKDKIRAAITKADDLARQANRHSVAASDPMRKGNAFPMGVGFTRMTKRASQRIDASVRRAGEYVKAFKKSEQAQKYADELLAGKGTDADVARKAAKREEVQRFLVGKLLNWQKGDKIGPVTVTRINKDRDGYPASYTIAGDGIITGVMDKVDVVREMFSGDKAKFRAMVDEVRAAPAASAADQSGATKQEDTPAPAAPATAAPVSALDAESNLWQRVAAGQATPDEFKAGFNGWATNKTGIMAELATKTKADLLKMGGSMFAYRYKSETKPVVVEALWRDGMSAYTLGRGYSYGMGESSQERAIRAIVDSIDAEALAEYATERKAAEEEAVARVGKVAEAIKEPKTLEDFRLWMRANMTGDKTFAEVRMMLTPEQRARFDDLAATETRGQRKQTDDIEKTRVRVAGQTVDGDIIATKHTRDGHDLYVVRLAERVSTEDYQTLLAGAKRIGGSYSSYRGNGAVPGFQFRTREAAEAFQKLAQGDNAAAVEAAKERRDAFQDDRSQTASERLTEMADRLDERADESLGRERKANTERRARFAANAEAAASADKAMATTMRRLASAITDGKAKFLDRVRQKVQVEAMNGYVRTAKDAEIRAKYQSYADQERHRGEPATAETADFAEFPSYTAYRSDLASLGRQLVQTEGTKKLGQQIMKVADDVSDAYLKFAKENFGKVATFTTRDGGVAGFSTRDAAEAAIARSGYRGKAIAYQVKRGEHTIILSPSEAVARGVWKGDGDKRITLTAEFGAELVEKIGRANRRGAKVSVPWQFEAAYDRKKLLSRMGINSPAEFRAALREFIAMREAPEAPSKVKEMERAMIGRRNDGLDFFPTPESTADEMVAAADIQPGMRVLEPSAGMGHIAERIRAAGIEPEVGEIGSERRELLEAKGFNVVAQDFLSFDDANQADRGYTYGDVFRAPDGAVGVVRGSGGMGSGRVRLEPLDADGNPDARRAQFESFADLVPVEKRGIGSGYDRILMNPPFSDGRDIQHVRHAYDLLKPGGRLVALMGESAFTNQGKRATEFREWLERVGGTEEKLAEGTFNDPSLPVNTGANARMVVIEKSASDAPAFSRTGPAFPAGTVKPAAMRAKIAKIASTWGTTLATPKVVDTVDDLPPRIRQAVYNVGAENQVRGLAMPNGDVYLVADNIGSVAEAQFVLFHEVYGHVGMRAFLGDSYGTQMRLLRQANPTLAKEADKWFAAYGEAEIQTRVANRKMTPEAAKRVVQDLAIEEALADRAGDAPELKGWQRVMAALQRALRKIGLGSVADMLEGMTEAETLRLLADARATVKGQQQAVGRMEPAMSRAPQTDSKAFRDWFGGSKVVDAEGNPLVVYHGTGNDFSTFMPSDMGEYGGGIYVTPDPKGASDYATYRGRTAPNVMPVYVSIKNPAGPAEAANIASWRGEEAVRSELIRRGYDGIIDKFSGQIVAFKPEQVKSAIGNVGTFDPADPDIRFSRTPNATPGTGWAMPEGTKFDNFVYKFQDKNIDLKRAVAEITKGRQAIEDRVDAYLQEELFHERAAKRTQDFVKDELGPVMKEMGTRGITMDALDEYLHNRHAEEANKVAAERNLDDQGKSTMPDGGSGIKTADARAYLAKLDPGKRKRLEAVAAKVDAIIARNRQTLVDYGLESQTVVDGWASMFDHYVPLMREDEGNGGGSGTGQGFSIKGKETKSRTGATDRKVVDILANIAMQRERAIVRGEKNRVAVALVGLVDANPAPNFWQADYIPTERVFNDKTGLVEERQIPGFKNRPNVLVAKVMGPNGEVQERAVVFNEDNARAMRMVESLKNLDATQLEGVLGISAKITRYFAAINTQYNPVFGFVNFIRDVQGAVINLTSTPIKGKEKAVLKDVMPALAGVFADARKARQGKAATSQWAGLWEEFQLEGGATGFRDLFRTSADRAKAIEREIDPTAWMNSTLGKVFTVNGILKVPMAQAQKAATWMFGWLSDYNLAMENAVRLSAYKVALDQGMTKQRAASLAKNLTVNFNRKGQAGMQAGALYAFFNASMQGTARMGDVMFEGQGAGMKLSGLGRKILLGGMALGAIQAMMLEAAGFDDDEPPPFVRERSLIIPFGALAGGKEYVSIPMPLGWHVIPNLGRMATEFALGGFKEPGKRAADLIALIADAFNPIGNSGLSLQTIAPTALDPLVALSENRDWTGKPIARESFDRTTPGFALAKDTASAPSKWISEAINLMSGGTKYTAGAFSPTPDQIDYLWDQVTGGVGRELSKVEQTATAAFTGETLPTYKIPLVGRFVGDAEGPTSQGNRFYENLNQISLHEAQIKGLIKDGFADEAQAYRAENPESTLIGVANMAERQVRKLRSRKRELLANDAPRDSIRQIEEQITRAMTRLNEAVERREMAGA